MRRKIVAGNWKMNKSRTEALNFFNEISNSTIPKGVSAMLFPPSLYISDAVSVLKNKIDIGAQNCYYPNNGAFTGEISAKMISSSGAKAVIIGHSERRQFFNETNELLALKTTSVIENGLVLVFCCGELLCERENGQHFDIIKEQLIKGLFHLNKTLLSNVVIAYEPVWAIGTGKTASATDAQEMHKFIRQLIAQYFDLSVAENTCILYGGSCNPSNAKELFKQADIDGGLIGGASLNCNDFLAVANSFN